MEDRNAKNQICRCFLTDDPRNVAGGRKGRDEYDTTLIFDDAIFDRYTMYMSGNGVITTKSNISPMTVYVA